MTHVALVLVKVMAHFACGAVAVVGQCFNNDRYSRRAVALINNVLVMSGVALAGGLFDYAVNVVVGNIVRLSLGNDILEL